MKKFGFLILTLLILGGCVGTVEDAKQAFSKVNNAPEAPLNFGGIFMASAISDSRIEVFFYPASGGSGKYTYDITISNAAFPISVPGEVMKTDFRGLLRHTITGLDRVATYILKVEVRDEETNVSSNTNITRTVTTFDNMVADFNGISSASNMPGQDGKDSIRVRWTPARSSGLTVQPWSPKTYEIVVVDSERLTPLDMDVTSFGPGDGRWVYGVNHDNALNEYVIRGLPSEKKFYVRMRAIHDGSVDDAYNPRRRSELNTNYISIATLSGELSDIDFQVDSFGVALAAGQQGLNAVIASWTQAKGVFDHYRIYYSKENAGVAAGSFPDLCLSPVLSPPTETVFCKRVDFDAVSTPITGLAPYEAYEIALVLCANTGCGPTERIVTPVRVVVTDPNTPTFNGLRDIRLAANLDQLGNLYLRYDPPNFTAGYFDGLVLLARRTTDGSDAPVEVTTHSAPLYHTPYNFLLNTEVVVRNVNYIAATPYCFTLHPYKWDADGLSKREFPNNIWKCVSPKPDAPTSDQFLGLGAGVAEDSMISFTWDPPSQGIFSHYELFWRKQSGQNFNWGDAIAQANNFDSTNYGRLLIDADQTSVVVENMADGLYYFGMITYYQYVTDDGMIRLRSETNANLRRCTVDAAATDPINCGN